MKFYGYNKCGTCRKAKKYLEDHGMDFEEIDITENPPPAAVLKRAIKVKGLKKLFNTSGQQYKELKMKEKLPKLSEAEALELLAGNGRLIKRPIVVEGDRVTVGFDAAEYQSVWG